MLLTISSQMEEWGELRNKSTSWDEAFRHAERGIVVGSPDGLTLELLNPAFARMLGYQIDELAGTPLINVFAPSVRGEVRSTLDLVARSEPQTFESLCIRKGGATFPVLVDATLLKSVEDSNLKRSEAEQANEAKSRFLSRMSHEFRTPLNVILGFAQVIQLDSMTPRQDESARHILHAGRHLLRLIDETLDISKVESGHLGLLLESVGVAEAVDEVFVLMRSLADIKGVRLVREPADLTCRAVADRQRLKQVLLN
ncbi:MAG: histidine kinase dimerization/phospho-acceptor domain-containing protein, partial [Polyangiales bacterium]